VIVSAVVVLGVLLGSEPFVAEVPPSGSLLDTPRPAPRQPAQPASRADRPPDFWAAPIEVRRGRLARGDWASSAEWLDDAPMRVIVAATWCPACHRLFERLSASPPERTMILFLDDEHLQRSGGRGRSDGRVLELPGSLERYPLAFYLMDARSPLADRTNGYPSTFTCTRRACKRSRTP
jgi:hypothetical protein